MMPAAMDSPAPLPTDDSSNSDALAHAVAVARPLVQWLVRSGVDYGALTAALKPLFLEAARAELQAAGTRQTDSALSLLSGLHRKDVRAYNDATETTGAAPALPLKPGRPTPAQQVVSRWLAGGHPQALPLSGDASGAGTSFDALARAVSKDVHPRSVLQELVRLGVAEEDSAAGLVKLRRDAFVPDRAHREAGQLLAESVADHLAAGVHNLTAQDKVRYLEQSVFADELSAASVRELEQLGNKLWSQVLGEMVKAATVLCERDAAAAAGKPAAGRVPVQIDQRLRLGMFCYSTRMESIAAAAPPAPVPIPARRVKKT